MSRPARIAFVTTGLYLGGAEKMLCKLLRSLDRTRFEPSVFSLLGEGPVADEIRALNIPVHPASSRSPLSLLGLVAGVRKRRFDLLQGWMYHGNLAAWSCRIAASHRPPLVWGVRASLDDTSSLQASTRLVIKLGGRLSRSADAILFNSNRSMEQHVDRAGYPSESSKVIENGFDCNVFAPDAADRLATRRRLGIADEAPVVGLIARYHPMKDHATFLNAAAAFVSKRPDARFILAGPGVDGTNRALMETIDRLGLSGAVSLLGPCSDTAPLYRAMDLCALSSSGVEGFPNVIGEAMACGTPCTVTDVGDCTHIVGDTGIVVPPGDAQALSRSWSELFGLDAAIRAKLGSAARARVLERWSLAAVASQYEALYLGLLDRKESL
jgi:glycosyltransferase involved in cell wall biosynthesis